MRYSEQMDQGDAYGCSCSFVNRNGTGGYRYGRFGYRYRLYFRETLQGLVRHIRSPYVFTNRWGKPFNDLKKSFKLACKRAETERCLKCQYATHEVGEGDTGKCPECGAKLERRCITDFRFHDLRHTAASHMIMSGVDIVTVKEILGHKSLTMTLRYAHLAPSHRQKAVDALEKCYDLVTLGEKTGNSDSQLCLFPKRRRAATH